MLLLQNPIVPPSIVSCLLSRVTIDNDIPKAMMVDCEVMATGGVLYGNYKLMVSNGSCTGIRKTTTPSSVNNMVEVFTLVRPTAYDTSIVAYHAGILSESAKLVELEAALQALGILAFRGVVS